MADLYAQANRFRNQVVSRERAAASDLVRAYGHAWTEIRTQLDRLTKEIEAERKAGRSISTGWLFQQGRLENLLRETEAQVGEFARFADDKIVNEQTKAVEAAQKHTAALVETQLEGRRPPGVLASFQRLPKEALNDLVGFTSDGTPLRALLDELGPSASANVRKALIQGVATGANPRKIAREVRQELGGDLVRALRISRTEVLRSYRESSIRGMAANAGVVEQWRWNATKTTRTCAMCLAMDGQTFPVTVSFSSHPQCRCGPLPVTKYFTPKETGAEWFARQSAADQREVLGPGKFELYAAGQLQLADLVAERQDPKWGLVRSERSLKAVRRAA